MAELRFGSGQRLDRSAMIQGKAPIRKEPSDMNLLRILGLNRSKPKRRLVNLEFEYGTHLPVLKSIVEVFQPRGVLELGAGKFSTPLFYHQVEKVVTVETDHKWIQEVARMLPPRDHFSLLHHCVPHLTSKTRFGAIPQHTKDRCVKHYQEIIKHNPALDFLFIDHISGLRAFTLFALYDQFDFVVYHDAEDKGYGYEEFPRFDNGDFLHHVLRAYIPHTGFLIRKKYSRRLGEFKRVLNKNALEYFTGQYHFDLQDLADVRLPELN
jgi:hypothetical protein